MTMHTRHVKFIKEWNIRNKWICVMTRADNHSIKLLNLRSKETRELIPNSKIPPFRCSLRFRRPIEALADQSIRHE